MEESTKDSTRIPQILRMSADKIRVNPRDPCAIKFTPENAYIYSKDPVFRMLRGWTLFFLLVCLNVNAQFTDRYWAFGDSAAIDFSIPSNPVPKCEAYFAA